MGVASKVSDKESHKVTGADKVHDKQTISGQERVSQQTKHSDFLEASFSSLEDRRVSQKDRRVSSFSADRRRIR